MMDYPPKISTYDFEQRWLAQQISRELITQDLSTDSNINIQEQKEAWKQHAMALSKDLKAIQDHWLYKLLTYFK